MKVFIDFVLPAIVFVISFSGWLLFSLAVGEPNLNEDTCIRVGAGCFVFAVFSLIWLGVNLIGEFL